MSIMGDMFGAHRVPTRKWTPKVEVSQDNVGQVPPEPLRVDPYAAVIATDPFDPAGGIVIPSGRFVGIGYSSAMGGGNNAYRFGRTDSGRTTIALHDGKNLTPVGFSVNQMYKETGDMFMTDSNTVKFRKSFVAEVPFVLSVNNAHGNLDAGDFVTGYWGSTTTASTNLVSYHHRGKPVKWNARKVYIATQSASAMIALTSAVYPGITPRVIATYAAGSLLTTATATLGFNSVLGSWVVTYTGTGSSTVTSVIYDYGQDADQIGGEILRIQSLSDILAKDDFLRWVEMAPSDWMNYPPAMTRFNVTQVTQETPTTVTAGSQYRVLTYPMSVNHAVLVEILGTVVDQDGSSTTYTSTWFPLPTSTVLDARGYFLGKYHTVNWRTGLIDIASNITVTSIRVSYSYFTDPREGAALWGGGILGLTDGGNTSGLANNGAGIPGHLNLADVVASMRVIVR